MTEAISAAAFREALAHFASGVTVVSARGAEGLSGFTATGFTSVSLSPPLILVCVGNAASAYDVVLGADSFAVSVHGEDQEWIAVRFATSGIDRFAGVPVRPGPVLSSAPFIEGALAHLECRPYARHEAGDHTLLIGQVLHASVATGRPLLHFRRGFGALAS
jgi:flavin reductase ActVB